MLIYLTTNKYNPNLCLFCQKNEGNKTELRRGDWIYEGLEIPEGITHYIDCFRQECLDNLPNHMEEAWVFISKLTGWKLK